MGYTHTIQRPYFERIDELALFDDFQVSLVSNGLHTNYLRVTTATSLSRDPGFSGGTAYAFDSPASVSPCRLGVRKGDKLLLVGHVGGEENDGRLVTIQSVAGSTIQVYESLATSYPAQQYEFKIMRKRS